LIDPKINLIILSSILRFQLEEIHEVTTTVTTDSFSNVSEVDNHASEESGIEIL
jgi:hypothetical protein